MRKNYKYVFAREKEVQNAAEELKFYYIKRTTKVKNSFSADFYCLCSEFAYADAISVFAENNCRSNILYKNLSNMNDVSWKRFFKIWAMYNTIMICRRKRKLIDMEFLKDDMFHIFEFDEDEKKMFNIMWQMAVSYEIKFRAIFPKVLLKYVLRKNITDAPSIAFTENICYNSYKNIIEYLSRYISVSRRVALAKQA